MNVLHGIGKEKSRLITISAFHKRYDHNKEKKSDNIFAH